MVIALMPNPFVSCNFETLTWLFALVVVPVLMIARYRIAIAGGFVGKKAILRGINIFSRLPRPHALLRLDIILAYVFIAVVLAWVAFAFWVFKNKCG
jgi:hypothetical protein